MGFGWSFCVPNGNIIGVPPVPLTEVPCTVFNFPSGSKNTLPPLGELKSVIFDKSEVLLCINFAVVVLLSDTFSSTKN